MSQAILSMRLARVGGLRHLHRVPLPGPSGTFHLRPALSSQRYIKMHGTQGDVDLPFPDLPSVNEDKERKEQIELPLPESPPSVVPEPDNPMPDLPPNHPKEVNVWYLTEVTLYQI
jgi:hypothetical protein